MQPFDAQTERVLLQLGIDAIYFLEGEIGGPTDGTGQSIPSQADE